MHDAAKLTGDAYTAQETKATTDKQKKAPSPKKEQKKSGVGWNPDAASEPTPPKKQQTKSKVGWNPDAVSSPTPPKKEQTKSKVGWNPGAISEPVTTPAPAPKASKVRIMTNFNISKHLEKLCLPR